jgi:hypothetical protein
MRCLWILTALSLVACTPSKPEAAAAQKAPPKATSGDHLQDQLKKDDEAGRTAPESAESGQDASREAVDVAARDAGLVEYLAGDKPAFVATHTMVELEEFGKAGGKVLYAAAGAHTITGQWSLKDGLLDMRFKLMDGDTLHEDAWLACTWGEDGADVTLVCGMPKSTQFGTADYKLSKAGARWTLAVRDERSAGEDQWPLRVVVDEL